MNFKKLYNILNYKFKDEQILIEALSHPSINKSKKNYQRMEFLGDSILSMIISDRLYNFYKNDNEGDLAKRRAALVSGDSISKIASKIGLGEFIIMDSGEENLCGRTKLRNLENCFEAVVAAIYIDGGIDKAINFVRTHFDDLLTDTKIPPKDPKSALQEIAQKRGVALPIYKLINSTGPAHAPIYTIELEFISMLSVKATASSKKAAENLAAIEMLSIINNEGN